MERLSCVNSMNFFQWFCSACGRLCCVSSVIFQAPNYLYIYMYIFFFAHVTTAVADVVIEEIDWWC